MSTETTGNSSPHPSSFLTRHPSSDAIDSTPLLLNGGSNNGGAGGGGGNGQTSGRGGGGRRSVRRQGLREAASFLRRASSGRMMREPSRLVRETAAEQLEERQSDWAYSKPVVVLDILWNLAFVSVAAAVLVLSRDEKPNMPLRVWIVGYALQCVLHMVCVCVEYRRRRARSQRSQSSASSSSSSSIDEEGLPSTRNSEERYLTLGQYEQENNSSAAKHLESANTVFSFIWWIIGFYWVSAGGQVLAQGSPQLYWLCIVFLGFDVFFVVFCVALACVIGIAVCCCLPCIIAVLYAVADQDGATKEDIEQLTKFNFRRVCDTDKLASDEVQGNVGGVMTECGTDTPIEHTLLQEDSECCICLSAYEDGVELRELPCGHHFHCECVDKWLFINATCPLCKYNILKSTDSHADEQV
ncbi:PREDICTED: E3 ubiquitin-protein ligase At1g63170-like isoform X2 [Tarenaya hassleriana]|uniref:E3 ubiquitin-protein ligase At1g63170-like isoform X2 n=1 Tax=Tarenaya hassleriana TaxID=28532 RepID=UPI00053C3B12|nr:PREDICTED: E3 ubiquitin-protein ligase At1g63170-like isoform X2 [Tarenaya hassleriana]